MKRALLGMAAVSLLACGGSDEDPAIGHVGFALSLSAPLAEQITHFQVSVLPATLPGDNKVDCAAVVRTCLSSLYGGNVLPLKDAAGAPVKALIFPAQLSAGAQTVRATGIPVGKDYVIVVEAMQDATLLGSACVYRQEGISSGANRPVEAQIAPISPPPACDPRF